MPRHRGRWLLLLAVVLVVGGFLVARAVTRARLARELLTTFPYAIDQHPELVRYALSVARSQENERAEAPGHRVDAKENPLDAERA